MASAVTRRGSIAGIIGLALGLSAGDDASARRRRRRRCTALYSPCNAPGYQATCCPSGGWCYGRPVEDGGILDRGVCRECGTLGDYCDYGDNMCCRTYQGNPMSCNGAVCVI